MSVLPQSREQTIIFCEQHVPVWAAAPTTIGLTAAMVTQLDNATKAARAKLTAANAARLASKAATTNYHADADTVRGIAADLLRFIKAFAENTANPDAVYASAQIPPPAPPTPNTPPGQPTDVTINLNPGGTLTFRWKSENSSPSTGAFFTVKRRLPTQTAFTSIGGSAMREFTDDTIPSGVSGAVYIIQGFRGTVAGNASNEITVTFGVGGGASATNASLSLAA